MKKEIKNNMPLQEESFTEDEILFREFVDKAFVCHSSSKKIMEKIRELPAPRRQSESISIFDMLLSMWNNWGRKLAPAIAGFVITIIVCLTIYAPKPEKEKKSVSLVSITALSSEATYNGKPVEGSFLTGVELALMQPMNLEGKFEVKIEGLKSVSFLAEGKLKLSSIASGTTNLIDIKGDNVKIKLNNSKDIGILVNGNDFMLQSREQKPKISKKKNKAVKSAPASGIASLTTEKASEESGDLTASASADIHEQARGARLIGRIRSLPEEKFVYVNIAQPEDSDETEDIADVSPIVEGHSIDEEDSNPFEGKELGLGE